MNEVQQNSTTQETLSPELSGLVSDLTYRSYAANRQYSPEKQPREWAPIFPQWEEFEARFQSVTYKLLHEAAYICSGAGSALYCGNPTVRCPRCNEQTDNCADHLWEEKSGVKVCVICWNGDPFEHAKDGDCTISAETGLCLVCGVGPSDEPCLDCGKRSFHADGCQEMAQ